MSMLVEFSQEPEQIKDAILVLEGVSWTMEKGILPTGCGSWRSQAFTIVLQPRATLLRQRLYLHTRWASCQRSSISAEYRRAVHLRGGAFTTAVPERELEFT
jgi:hypothetical protein